MKPFTPRITPTCIGYRIVRYLVQPWQRVIGEVVKVAPSSDESISGDFLSLGVTHTSPGKGHDFAIVRFVESSEPLLRFRPSLNILVHYPVDVQHHGDSYT
jgi:hypothetical protein